MNTIGSRIKRNNRERLKILGAAVGSPRFVGSSIQKRVQKIEKLLQNLEYINDPQCALGILRSCMGATKTVYSLRCNTPSEEAVNIFEEFDSLQRTTFDNITGTLLSNESRHQACLPIWNCKPTSVYSDKSSLYWLDIAVCYISRAYNWPKSDS